MSRADHAKHGARSFGFDERLPEGELNQLGYGVLQILKKPSLAVWVFGQNVLLYPESANVYDSLGDGLLAVGDTTAAIAQFKRAVDVGTRNKQPTLPSVVRLKTLEASRAAKPSQ